MARAAEPLILLTGAVLWRLRRLYEKPENRQKSKEHRCDDGSRTSVREKTEFWAPGCDLASILAAPKHFGRSRALLLASRAALGDPSGDPGACRGRPKTLPRRSREAFRMLLGTTGRPERVAGSILSRFWMLRGSSGQLSGSIWDRFSNDWPKKID